MLSSARPAVWRAVHAVPDAWAPADFAAARVVIAPPADTTEQVRHEAYAQGLADGRAEGERAERARLRSTVRAAEEAAEVIDASNANWTGAAQDNVIALAVAVARHIVGRELALDPTIVGKLVARALTEFPIDQPLRVRLNPDDLAVLQSLEDDGVPQIAEHADRGTRWVADARVSSGGCVVEGRERIVDGRVEPALERIYRRLTHNHA